MADEQPQNEEVVQQPIGSEITKPITINKVASRIEWHMIQYPKSNTVYYALLTEEGEKVKEGNIDIPKEVEELWGTDNDVIKNYILTQLN